MPLYEYVCTDEECTYSKEPFDKMSDISKRDDQICDSCGSELKRQVTGIKTKHLSWSTWQIR